MKKYFLKISIIGAIIISFSSCRPGAVVVRTRPPAPVIIRPVAPGSSYVWVEGDWVRYGDQYAYKQGYWAAPRRGRASRTPGHWREGKRGWYWISGHWR